MKLSANFDLHEFTRSETAVRQDIQEQFSPPSNVVNNLSALCKEVLQPLRSSFGARIFITSGYRCQRLNVAVKGSTNSDHLRGMAADVTCKDPEMLYQMTINMKLPFRQLIYYQKRNFVHISFNPEDVKRQAWITFK